MDVEFIVTDHVYNDGTVHVFRAINHNREVEFAAEHRSAADLIAALNDGIEPLVVLEPRQIIRTVEWFYQ